MSRIDMAGHSHIFLDFKEFVDFHNPERVFLAVDDAGLKRGKHFGEGHRGRVGAQGGKGSRVNIYDLGLIYSLDVDDDGKVEVAMTLTAPGCGMGPVLQQDAQTRILGIEQVDDVSVELVWDPPWNQDMISEEGKMKLGMM